MWSQNLVSIFLCAWHVLKAWCLCSMEKIKALKVRCVVLDHLHTMMFMSINLYESIDGFKVGGREMVMESFNKLQPNVAWTRYFGLNIANSISKGSPFQVWHLFKPFCYGCIISCMFNFHTYSNYIMGWKYVVHVHAKLWMVGFVVCCIQIKTHKPAYSLIIGALKCWFSLETKGVWRGAASIG